MTEEQLRERINQFSRSKREGKIKLVENTSEFMNINYDDILTLEGSYYLIRGDETEQRFGLEGQPKFWVKKAIDLADGSPKIIKLVFHESLYMDIGGYRIKYFRSPIKEGRILEKVKEDQDFMQGITVYDSAGNTVRIVDKILGSNLYDFMFRQKMDHETYLHNHFLPIFRNTIASFEAIERLHEMGEVHGDIRTDHILIDRTSQRFKWIDFDYMYEWSEHPLGLDLLCLGNILLFIIGKGFYHISDLAKCGPEGEAVLASIRKEDTSLFSINRIVNLKKLFFYVPECLNYVLLHFAQGAEVPYESVREILEDLRACEESSPFKRMSQNLQN
jgi:hypothetical protein